MDSREVLDAIYLNGPFGATGYTLHAATWPLALLIAYALLRLGRRDYRKILLWFAVGWLGHTLVDFLTHAEDPRPLLYPFLDWTWSSPVSYYDPDHYGVAFALASNGLAVVLMAALLIRRLFDTKTNKKHRV